jgi:hypothetical protein
MASEIHTDARGLPSLPVLCVAAYLLYLIGRAFYRLYFHPLAKFPGPRLAAATTFYEAYFEIVLKGQYSKQISKLHDEYGKFSSVVCAHMSTEA